MSDNNQVSGADENVDFDVLKQQLEEKERALQDVQSQFEAVRRKQEELLNETKKAKAKAREEADAAAKAEREKAQKNGDFEQLLKSSERERQQMAEQLQSMQQLIANEKINSEAMKLAAELADGSNAELLCEFISKRLRYSDDGVRVVDQSGQLTVSSMDDLKREFENSNKFKALLRGSRSSGGGATGDQGAPVKVVNTMQRQQFEGLAPGKQMEFIKSGGKISD